MASFVALSPEHEMLRDMCRKYADEELKPDAGMLDKEHKFPEKHVKWIGENGLMGVSVNPDWGGSGMDYLACTCIAPPPPPPPSFCRLMLVAGGRRPGSHKLTRSPTAPTRYPIPVMLPTLPHCRRWITLA